MISLVLLAAAPAGVAQPVDVSARMITAQDLLEAEQLGPVQISSDGAAALISVIVGANRIDDSSFEDPSVAGQRLQLVDIASGRSRALGRPGRYGAVPGRGWSPTADFLSIYDVRGQDLGLSVMDRRSRRVVALPGRWGHVTAWSRNTLLYDTLSADRVQPLARRQLLRNLTQRWTSAWAGAASVSVSDRSGTFALQQPSAGALMAYDAERGRSFKVADGDFISVIPSAAADAFAAVRLAEVERDPLNPQPRRGELIFFVRDGRGYREAWRRAGLDVGAGAISFSPDGRQLLVGAKPAGADRSRLELHVISAADGHSTQLQASGLNLRNFDVGALNPFWQIGWVDGMPAAIASMAMAHASTGVRLSYGQAEGRRPDLYIWADRGRECLTCSLEQPVTSFLSRSGQRGALTVSRGGLWNVGAGKQPLRVRINSSEAVLGFGVDEGFPARSPEQVYQLDQAGERLALWVGRSEQRRRIVADLATGDALEIGSTPGQSTLSPTLNSVLALEQAGWTQTLFYRVAGQSRPLLRLNADLAGVHVATPQPFRYSWNGQALQGWVLRPAKQDHPSAALVHVYGGLVHGATPPHGAGPTVLPPVFSGQLLAAQGYAVVYPSTPVPRGIEGDVPAALAGATVAAVDEAGRQGIIDTARVGLLGHSFGGFSVAAILGKRSDRFRAGVSISGVYDWAATYGDVPARHRLGDPQADYLIETKMIETGQIQLQAPFWSVAEAYRRNSPIYDVDRISSPLLMLHGDLDMATTGLSGAERMYNALVRVGQRPALVRYWGEGHVVQSPGAMLDQWLRTLRWLNEHVGGAARD